MVDASFRQGGSFTCARAVPQTGVGLLRSPWSIHAVRRVDRSCSLDFPSRIRFLFVPPASPLPHFSRPRFLAASPFPVPPRCPSRRSHPSAPSGLDAAAVAGSPFPVVESSPGLTCFVVRLFGMSTCALLRGRRAIIGAGDSATSRDIGPNGRAKRASFSAGSIRGQSTCTEMTRAFVTRCLRLRRRPRSFRTGLPSAVHRRQ